MAVALLVRAILAVPLSPGTKTLGSVSEVMAAARAGAAVVVGNESALELESALGLDVASAPWDKRGKAVVAARTEYTNQRARAGERAIREIRTRMQ